jgi:hypothetical protein
MTPLLLPLAEKKKRFPLNGFRSRVDVLLILSMNQPTDGFVGAFFCACLFLDF